MDPADVVIVGGGIAGSALAAALASAGLDVLLLERQTTFRDKVRGEYMHPWGVAEAIRLGVEGVLFAAGGGVCTGFIPYTEGLEPSMAESLAISLVGMLPGVAGAINCGHPEASDALNRHAGARGARVLRGVGDVEVSPGPAPSVQYEFDGNLVDVACRIVVGADGRQSTVRRRLGIELEQRFESTATLGGLLVHTDDWTSDMSLSGTAGDAHYLAFPRPGGFVRLYIACLPTADTTGPDKERRLRDAFRVACLPMGETLANAESAGPCAFYQGVDAWTAWPIAEGVVLIGDAAGWNDPIIGEGLSIAMRDARTVADVLLAGPDWSPAAFAGYAAERNERMRRLRLGAHVNTQVSCDFRPAGLARRAAFNEDAAVNPLTGGIIGALFAGPEVVPAAVFEPENIERVLSLA